MLVMLVALRGGIDPRDGGGTLLRLGSWAHPTLFPHISPTLHGAAEFPTWLGPFQATKWILALLGGKRRDSALSVCPGQQAQPLQALMCQVCLKSPRFLTSGGK